MFTNIERPVHHRFARYAENIAIVSESVAEDTNVSILRRSQAFFAFRSILTSKPADILQQAVDGNFLNKKFSSAMKHISRWAGVSEDPQVIEERPLHSDKVTI